METPLAGARSVVSANVGHMSPSVNLPFPQTLAPCISPSSTSAPVIPDHKPNTNSVLNDPNLNQTLTLNPTPPLSSSLTPTISQNSNPVTLKHDPNQGAGVCNSDFQGACDGKMSGPVSGRHVFRILPLPPPHSLARDVTLTTATDDVVWRGEASWTYASVHPIYNTWFLWPI